MLVEEESDEDGVGVLGAAANFLTAWILYSGWLRMFQVMSENCVSRVGWLVMDGKSGNVAFLDPVVCAPETCG